MSKKKKLVSNYTIGIFLIFFCAAGAFTIRGWQLKDISCNTADINREFALIINNNAYLIGNYSQCLNADKNIVAFRTKLDFCKKKLISNMTVLDQLISDLQALPSMRAEQQQILMQLKETRKAHFSKIADWNLFDYESSLRYGQNIARAGLTSPYILTIKNRSIWNNLSIIDPIHFDIRALYQQSGFIELIQHAKLTLALLCLLVGLGIYLSSTRVGALALSYLSTKPVIIDKKYLLIVPLTLLCGYMHLIFYHLDFTPILAYCVDGLLIYSFCSLLIHLDLAIKTTSAIANTLITRYALFILMLTAIYQWLLTPAIHQTKFFPFQYLDLRFSFFIFVGFELVFLVFKRDHSSYNGQIISTLLKRFRLVIIALLLYGGTNSILQGQNLSHAWLGVFQAISIVIYNVLLLWVVWPCTKWHFREKIVSSSFILYSESCFLGLFSIIILAGIQGYHHFAVLFIPDLILTIGAGFLLRDINNMLSDGYQQLSDPNQELSQRLRRFFNIGQEDKLIELYIMKTVFLLPPMFFCLIGILEQWGLLLYQVERKLLSLKNGIPIFGQLFHPQAFFRGALFFVFMLLLGRALASYASTQKALSKNKQAKAMVFLVIKYFSFIISLIIMLSISGISLSSLFLLSGALTVGLGFGLQRFASDFISGIILFINKPIKIGDHVIIGDYEGFIKNIHMLSTQINTLNNADILIPNTNLITLPITNLTYNSNKCYRIGIKVTTSEHVDAKLVQNILLDIAKKNPEIVQEEQLAPRVMVSFNSFTLSCYIINVNHKDTVESELSLAIMSAFEEKKIGISLT